MMRRVVADLARREAQDVAVGQGQGQDARRDDEVDVQPPFHEGRLAILDILDGQPLDVPGRVHELGDAGRFRRQGRVATTEPSSAKMVIGVRVVDE